MSFTRGKEHKILLNLQKPTGNFWVDTGSVVLIQQFGEGEHSAHEVLRWLNGKLLRKTGNEGEYYDAATGQLRKYEKENWDYPVNMFIKVAGTSGKKVKIEGKDYPTQPPKFELKLELSRKPNVCDLCGDTAPLTDTKMWMYPFVVDPQKFGTFYPGTKRGLRVCARCALAGLAGYLGWLWKAQGQDALHFFIFHSDLREMKRLHEEILRPLRIGGGKGGTAPAAFSGSYLHETTLGLLLELFSHVRRSELLPEEGRQYLATLLGASEASPPSPITLYAITGAPGRAFNMQALWEFSKLQALYRLYERWIEEIADKGIDNNPHQRIVLIFSQFKTQQANKNKVETIWRDKVARAVLEFNDPMSFVEQFLFDARAKEQNPRPLERGTTDVLELYLKEVLSMDEKFQQILAGFGHSLGALAQEHGEMGLLYSLRNAKNPEDFYRVLNDVQFRIETTIPEALLKIEKGERIAGTPWVRVKTLLCIYAMNEYLRKSRERAPQAEKLKEGAE